MPVQLLPELWMHVISLLRRPLPRPTGKNERSCILQPDLCAIMRLFNNIASPLLYTTVVTDHLPYLVYGLERRGAAARGIKSKRELLGMTERLYLEYCSKEDASYEKLLRTSGHTYEFIGLTQLDIVQLCCEECDWIATCAEMLHGPMRKLLSIATAAFLGGQSEIWEPLCKGSPPGHGFPKRTTAPHQAISQLIANPYLAYFCERAAFGPLKCGSFFEPDAKFKPRTSAGPNAFQCNVHMELDTGAVPVVCGGASSWYCPYDRPDSDPGINGTAEKLRRYVIGHLSDRDQVFKSVGEGDAARLRKKDLSLHVNIYVPESASSAKDIARLEKTVVESKNMMQMLSSATPGASRGRKPDDVFRIRSVRDAERCRACDWCPDDLDNQDDIHNLD